MKQIISQSNMIFIVLPRKHHCQGSWRIMQIVASIMQWWDAQWYAKHTGEQTKVKATKPLAKNISFLDASNKKCPQFYGYNHCIVASRGITMIYHGSNTGRGIASMNMIMIYHGSIVNRCNVITDINMIHSSVSCTLQYDLCIFMYSSTWIFFCNVHVLYGIIA